MSFYGIIDCKGDEAWITNAKGYTLFFTTKKLSEDYIQENSITNCETKEILLGCLSRFISVTPSVIFTEE